MAAPDPGATGTTRFDRRRERTRQALIDAAVELFQANGIDSTTIEQICERADVSPRTFFNHFETRDHLYAAITDHRTASFALLLDACTEDPRPVRARLPELFALVGRTVAAAPAYRELVGEMNRARPGGRATSPSSPLGEAALRFVRDGVRRGEVTRAHRPQVLADILLGTLSHAVTNWSVDPSFDLERELKRAALALLDLLEPR